MNFKSSNNYIPPVDKILASLVNTSSSKINTSHIKTLNARLAISRKKGSITLIPKDGSIFFLK